MPYVADAEKSPTTMLKNDSVRDMKRHELADAFQEEDPTLSDNQAHYMAGKIKRASQRRDLGFYEAMKVLGIISDTTARNAIRNIERHAA